MHFFLFFFSAPRCPTLLLKIMETSSTRVSWGRATRQVLRSARCSSMNTRNSSRFGNIKFLKLLPNLSNRKHSRHGGKIPGINRLMALLISAMIQGFKFPKFLQNHSISMLRKTGCVEETVKNKINKMSYLHIYYGALGATKFSKNELYGWQVNVLISPPWLAGQSYHQLFTAQ